MIPFVLKKKRKSKREDEKVLHILVCEKKFFEKMYQQQIAVNSGKKSRVGKEGESFNY